MERLQDTSQGPGRTASCSKDFHPPSSHGLGSVGLRGRDLHGHTAGTAWKIKPLGAGSAVARLKSLKTPRLRTIQLSQLDREVKGMVLLVRAWFFWIQVQHMPSDQLEINKSGMKLIPHR